MKKILLFVFCTFISSTCNAIYYYETWNGYGSSLTYKVDDAVKSAWGNPTLSATFIQDASKDYGKFRIKEGYACCADSTPVTSSSFSSDKSKDDVAIIALVAHNITEHGAEFCLTQFAAASGGSEFPIYHQQPNWPGLNCAWFCEPGYDGAGCLEKTNENSTCDTTDYEKTYNTLHANANYNDGAYTGNDSITLHRKRMGVGEYTAALDFKKINNFYHHEIVIGAVDFMQHGIVARPVLLAAVGNHPYRTYLTSSGITSGIKKTLCAQGFTKNDKCEISSKNCGSNIWCNGYSDSKLNTSIHNKQMSGFCNVITCKDGSKGLNDNFQCVDCGSAPNGRCDVLGNAAFGKCVKCDTGKYFDSATCECVVARRVTKEDMQYGSGGSSAIVSEQCWAKESFAEYRKCVEDTAK